MDAWSNIEISPQDPEIIRINNLQKSLGELPENVSQICELITRFEVCHFKYRQHLDKIKNSILNLQPEVVPNEIGINHIQHGPNAWRNDTTGRSLIGQQYLWAIKKWLSGDAPEKYYNKELGQQVQKWLGVKNPVKKRLVRLLIARLTWDWKSYTELQRGGKFKELEYQACRMDICHYAFPRNLNLLLQGIGKMKPVGNFEGCGSYGNNRKIFVEKQFSIVSNILLKLRSMELSDKYKNWLIVCLAKTIKEQAGMQKPILFSE
jgi:hypothetical protein